MDEAEANTACDQRMARVGQGLRVGLEGLAHPRFAPVISTAGIMVVGRGTAATTFTESTGSPDRVIRIKSY